MIKKLRRKFIIIVLSIVFVVISTIISVINVVNYQNIKKETDKIINVLVDNDGKMPLPPFMVPDNSVTELPPETPFQTRYFTVLIASNGEISVNMERVVAITEEQAIKYAKNVLNKDDGGFYKDYKYTTVTQQDGVLCIFLDCSKELGAFREVLKASIVVGGSAILIIAILVIVFSAFAVKPIAESYTKQKRFITDANHEIKTPLAIIGATNEVIQMEYGENEWSKTINNQINKLNKLTEKLVFLSRMDEETPKVVMSEFSLSETVSEVIKPFYNIAKVQEKEFIVNVTKGLSYYGDVSLIGQLVSVLVENAFKYSTEKGEISVNLEKSGKSKKLIISNTVKSVNKKDLYKYFDRFYRSEESRNSETGGSGLGLSIAKAIVNIHKGGISVNLKNDKLYFTVIF